jgi:hypothetical protein
MNEIWLSDVYVPLNDEQIKTLPGYVEHRENDGMLWCLRCGHMWPTGPILMPECPRCSGFHDLPTLD